MAWDRIRKVEGGGEGCRGPRPLPRMSLISTTMSVYRRLSGKRERDHRSRQSDFFFFLVFLLLLFRYSEFVVGVWLCWSNLFFSIKILLCDEQNCVLLTGTCIYLLTVAYFRFEILNCVQKKKKKDKSQPANCSYFICKASNDKYFKWLSI